MVSHASAQPTARAELPLEQARIHNGRAQELHEKGDLEGALEEFELSYRIYASPTILYNAAFVCEELGRNAQALIYYESYLDYEKHASSGRAPSKRDAAEEAVARLRGSLEPTMTRLSVETDDSETVPRVTGPDHRQQPVGLVPNVWYLPFGTYEVTVATTDGEAITQRVVLTRGKPLDVRLSLETRPNRTAPEASNLATWGWGTLGGGTAIAITGVVLVVVGEGSISDAKNLQAVPAVETPQDFATRQSDLRSTGESELTAGYVLTGVGIAGAVTGAVLLALDSSGSETAAAGVLPMIDGSQVGVFVRF